MKTMSEGIRPRGAFAALAVACLMLLMTGASPATAQLPPPDFLVTVPSSHGFDETLALLIQAIEGQNLMVVHEINPQQMLRMVGMRVGGMRQILFFHPRYMRTIVETNRNAGIVPPLKVLVMEAPDGRVMVRYHDPEELFEPYDGLSGMASELKGAVEQVVASVR